MKTAIIILTILTFVFWFVFKFLQVVIYSDSIETIKLNYGFSDIGFIAGVSRVLCWLCGIADIVLLLMVIL